jgi:hypothetical protein
MSEGSDVYVIATWDPKTKQPAWWCCGCHRPNHFVYSQADMLAHLYQHRKDGDNVPEHAIERLLKEISEASSAG